MKLSPIIKPFAATIILVIIVSGFVILKQYDYKDFSPEASPSIESITHSQEIGMYKQCVEKFTSELCKMFEPEEKQKLYENCAKVEIPVTADDTALYPDLKIAVVRWWDNNIQDNVAFYLPYEPEYDFSGCSPSAQEKLKHIQQSAIPQ